jgi:hypothetical protein
MRARSPFRALLCALLCVPPLSAPALGDDAPGSVDSLVAKLADLRKQRAALEKAEADVRGQLKAELKRIADLVAALEPDAVPPKPKPVEPPVPADPLRDKVREAVRASAGADAEKRAQALDLAALYRALAGDVSDAKYATADDLKQQMVAAAARMLRKYPADALLPVRRLVALELAAALPAFADAPLTDDHRAAAAKLFGRFGALLEAEGK